jgi:hypothetical protein
MQMKATLLINPRLSSHEFTKYSFPSKTIEFLGSGTPTILYKSYGVPDEYYDYCIVPEFETTSSLKDTIIEYCKLPESTLNLIGHKAKSFIEKKKSINFQIKRIYNFIEN